MTKKSASSLAPKAVSMFQCPKCKEMSKTKTVIEKCLAKHLVEEAKRKTQDQIEAEAGTYRNYIVNNLKTVRADDVRQLFCLSASSLGFQLIFHKFDKSYNERESLSFSTSGTFKKIAPPPSCFEAKRSKYTGLFRDNPWMGDFCDFLSGVSTGGGSGGSGGTFNYQIYIRLTRIPELLDKVTERKELKAKEKLFVKEVERLKAIHLKEYEAVIIQTDVEAAILKSDLKEQSDQLNALNTLYRDTNNKFNARRDIIIKAHQKDHIIPAPEFHYDQARFAELNEFEV